MQALKPILNYTAYHFVALAPMRVIELRFQLKAELERLGIRGTVLLSNEGMNLFLAGEEAAMHAFQDYLQDIPEFSTLDNYKYSYSEDIPYRKLLVKVKKEIISMGHDEVKPYEHTAKHLEPKTLKAWYEDNKDMVILDTRNDYEVRLGTFEKAEHLDIKKFRDFPDAIAKLPESYKDKPIVTFCTGGIRCEKAAEYMLQRGFKEVYQLNGGILNYFHECGGAHYEGECFVFDKRVAIDPELTATTTAMCFGCRGPMTQAEQQIGVCPYCGDENNFG